MKSYKVTITETSKLEVTVKAVSLAEAEEIVEGAWNNEKYVLDASHFVEAKFNAEPIQKERGYDR
jgi:hypothetical protein